MKAVAVACLALALSAGELKGCRKVVVNGPKTDECKAGRYVVVVDDTKNPPEISQYCENPTPPASPSPTAPPSAEPSPQANPSPVASPSPIASPSPVASPSPIASPSASPDPAAPPIGPDGNYPVPEKGTLPKWFDVPPVSVGLGDEPKDQGAGTDTWHVYLFHATPRAEEPLCGHKPDGKPDKKGNCEQWAPAADAQASRGEGALWWFAEYPGTGCNQNSWDNQKDCGVEHPSRSCIPAEKEEDVRNRPEVSPEQARAECARPHANVGRDRVGVGGGPEGIRKVCVAPHGRPAEATCRRWELTIRNGWSAR